MALMAVRHADFMRCNFNWMDSEPDYVYARYTLRGRALNYWTAALIAFHFRFCLNKNVNLSFSFLLFQDLLFDIFGVSQKQNC